MRRPARFHPLLLVCLAALACPGRRTEVLARAGTGADEIRIVLHSETSRSGSNHSTFAPRCDTYTVDEVFLEVGGADRKVWWDHDRDLAYAIEVRAPQRIAVRRGHEPWQVFVRDGDRLEPQADAAK
ncbi:hypothetical protein [Nannocystis pusilla]|uniref:Uncharacterized protein n=1 Tax=Nannocystis pusilla TaxID=889268 RepID=A0ABS7TQX4_9BACT|nr:hypothetical protein [Nannocystis pusilla]MBZ5710628.1 hypothetical protein [Nannocystis pusilla]